MRCLRARYTEVLNAPAGTAILQANAKSTFRRSIDERLAGRASISKQAFLLVSMEGFSAGDAVGLFGRSDAEFRQRLATAHREIADRGAADIFIIEDAPPIARDLEWSMIDMGHRVVGLVRTHRNAGTAIGDMSPPPFSRTFS